MLTKESEKIIYIGSVGVDSGQLMITDPCYVSSFKNESYRDVRKYKHTLLNKELQYGKDFGNMKKLYQSTIRL